MSPCILDSNKLPCSDKVSIPLSVALPFHPPPSLFMEIQLGWDWRDCGKNVEKTRVA